MIKEAIGKVIAAQDLTRDEMEQVMDQIMSGEATPAQIGAFITGLRIKGETVDEITGAAVIMRQKALRVEVPGAEPLVDTCGTGGDSSGTFNISTASAFVVSGAGLKVAKHGNCSVSSKCGSADVLKELGVNIEMPADKAGACIAETGIGFLFAPLFHSAMKHAIGPRREIGIRTVFNILGPLTNPAGASSQVLGVYDRNLTEVLAEVLNNLGTEAAYVIHGLDDNLDEVSITGPTKVTELRDKKVRTFEIKPEDFGLKSAGLDKIKGGDAKENADMIIKILEGQKGPSCDIVLLNSALCLHAGGKSADIAQGLEQAKEAIDSGKAMEKLKLLQKFTNH